MKLPIKVADSGAVVDADGEVIVHGASIIRTEALALVRAVNRPATSRLARLEKALSAMLVFLDELHGTDLLANGARRTAERLMDAARKVLAEG